MAASSVPPARDEPAPRPLGGTELLSALRHATDSERRTMYLSTAEDTANALRQSLGGAQDALELAVEVVAMLPTPPFPLPVGEYRTWLQTAAEQLRAAGSPREVYATATLAFIEAMHGEQGLALQLAEDALARREQLPDRIAAQLYRRLARLAVDQGRGRYAYAMATRALKIAGRLDASDEQSECLLLFASIDRQAFGDPTSALERMGRVSDERVVANVRGRLRLLKAECYLALGHTSLARSIIDGVDPEPEGRAFLNSYLQLFGVLADIEDAERPDTSRFASVREEARRAGASWVLLQTYVWEALMAVIAGEHDRALHATDSVLTHEGWAAMPAVAAQIWAIRALALSRRAGSKAPGAEVRSAAAEVDRLLDSHAISTETAVTRFLTAVALGNGTRIAELRTYFTTVFGLQADGQTHRRALIDRDLKSRVVVGKILGADAPPAFAGETVVVSSTSHGIRFGSSEFRATDRTCRVLAALIELRVVQPGRYLSRNEIMDIGWPGDRSSDQAMGNRIRVMMSELRKAGIGDALESVPQRGYRFSEVVPLVISAE